MSRDLFSQGMGDIKLLLEALDSVQEGITLIDKNGYVRYANQAACRIMGVERSELIASKADRLARNKPLLMQIVDQGEPIIDREYFMEFNGRTIHLINSGYPVRDELGNINGAIDIFMEIQRSRKLANDIAGYSALFTFDHFVGQASRLCEAIRLAKAYSQNDENVLIIGESGTGKDLFAQSIHNYSGRRTRPFIAINCANFPNDLIDSELFGYEDGTFTGSVKGGKPGKFEAANGGTLFLDEIGEMPIHLQAKLLRVIETKYINRLGGNKAIRVDVKIVAATNRDLETLVASGCFRQDLYFRLKVLFLEIPPLRERGSDVMQLATYFTEKLGAKIGKSVTGFDEDASQMLSEHHWPGNVRELENTIARALILCDGEMITGDVLRSAGLRKERAESIKAKGRAETAYEKERVLSVLQQAGGNKKRAAELLGISRPTLYKLLTKYM